MCLLRHTAYLTQLEYCAPIILAAQDESGMTQVEVCVAIILAAQDESGMTQVEVCVAIRVLLVVSNRLHVPLTMLQLPISAN